MTSNDACPRSSPTVAASSPPRPQDTKHEHKDTKTQRMGQGRQGTPSVPRPVEDARRLRADTEPGSAPMASPRASVLLLSDSARDCDRDRARNRDRVRGGGRFRPRHRTHSTRRPARHHASFALFRGPLDSLRSLDVTCWGGNAWRDLSETVSNSAIRNPPSAIRNPMSPSLTEPESQRRPWRRGPLRGGSCPRRSDQGRWQRS